MVAANELEELTERIVPGSHLLHDDVPEVGERHDAQQVCVPDAEPEELRKMNQDRHVAGEGRDSGECGMGDHEVCGDEVGTAA